MDPIATVEAQTKHVVRCGRFGLTEWGSGGLLQLSAGPYGFRLERGELRELRAAVELAIVREWGGKGAIHED